MAAVASPTPFTPTAATNANPAGVPAPKVESVITTAAVAATIVTNHGNPVFRAHLPKSSTSKSLSRIRSQMLLIFDPSTILVIDDNCFSSWAICFSNWSFIPASEKDLSALSSFRACAKLPLSWPIAFDPLSFPASTFSIFTKPSVLLPCIPLWKRLCIGPNCLLRIAPAFLTALKLGLFPITMLIFSFIALSLFSISCIFSAVITCSAPKFCTIGGASGYAPIWSPLSWTQRWLSEPSGFSLTKRIWYLTRPRLSSRRLIGIGKYPSSIFLPA